MFSPLGWSVISVVLGPVLLRGLLRGLGLGLLFGAILGMAYQHRLFGLALGGAILILSVISEIPLALRRYRGAMAMVPIADLVDAYLGPAPRDMFRSITPTSQLDPDIAFVSCSQDGTRQVSWTPTDRRLTQAPGPHLHLSTVDPTTGLITATYCVPVPQEGA